MVVQTSHSAALFGEDHDEVAAYAMCSVGVPSSGRPLTCCAISVGDVAALVRKGGTEVPNEDCLYAYDDGRYVIHIIADGHHGHEASHDLVEALGNAYDEHGPTLDTEESLELAHRASLVAGDPDAALSVSRSTLLIARLDRREGRLGGVSLGDSPLFIGSVETGVRRVVEPNTRYVAPWDPELLGVAAEGSRFSVPVNSGEWILSCSDGVTECHYGTPDTSIQPSDIDSLMIRACGSPDAFVELLAALALTGVRGHPGGEDNVAIVASVV